MTTKVSCTVLGLLFTCLGGIPCQPSAQADKARLFVQLDSVGRVVRSRWTDTCVKGLQIQHSKECDVLADSSKALEASIKNLHYRNPAGIDVDSARKAMGHRVTDCFAGALDSDHSIESCREKARAEDPVGMCFYEAFKVGTSVESALTQADTCRPTSQQVTSAAPQKTLKAPAISQDGSFAILDFRTKTLETNDVWWRFGWVTTLKNN